MRDISKNLKDARIESGMKQEELAEQLFCKREVISYYENGKRNPDIQMLKLLSEYFNVSI